jgi:uncharacterized protein
VSPTIDAHVHVGRSLQGYRLELPDLLRSMDRLGIARSVLYPVRPLGYAYPTENDAVAAAVAAHPDRFWGLGRVDARQPDAAAEADRCLGRLGLRGIYLQPFEDAVGVAEPVVDPILARCAEAGAPVVIAAGYPWVSEAPQVGDVARRHPTVPIVMTNGGQINISGLGQRNAWLVLERCPNTYITTAGVYRQDFLEEVIGRIGAERVLFASQSPIFDQDYELHRVRWAHVDQDSRDRVIGANAARLFGRG